MDTKITVPLEGTQSKSQAKMAAVLSALWMGLGQLFNRQIGKGLLFFAAGIFEMVFIFTSLGEKVHGLITLGEHPGQIQKVDGIYQMVPGDHSIFLMLEGVIALFVLILFLSLHYASVKDAYRVAKEMEEGKSPNRFAATLANLKDRNFVYVLLFLPIIATLFFTVLPIVFSVLLAFTNFSAPRNIPPAGLVNWVGFQTFIDLFTMKAWSQTFFGVAAWTVVWAVSATVTCYFGGILLAVLINQEGIRFKKFWRTVMIIPWAIPAFVSLLIMRNIYNGQFGPINQYLKMLGFEAIPWLTDPMLAKFTVIFVNMWVGIPVTMVLVTGVLASIPKELYEAADMDGATSIQKFWKITMPMILFATAPLLIMQFAGNINNFNVIFLLTDGNPPVAGYQSAGGTDLLITWLYKLTLQQNQFNMASAIGILIFIFISVFSIVNYRRTRSFKEEDMIQ
ncbi:carbohydrate ABC transporter permease [Ammoniphilus sp. 3BR4]|uniref:carbohydrate ABC transporter permease n=1 Tax=Ammoniphilus sp. 3BR4 TaxID=3158265 RepID=UPI0034661994